MNYKNCKYAQIDRLKNQFVELKCWSKHYGKYPTEMDLQILPVNYRIWSRVQVVKSFSTLFKPFQYSTSMTIMPNPRLLQFENPLKVKKNILQLCDFKQIE